MRDAISAWREVIPTGAGAALRLLVLLIAALSQPDLLVTGETAGREWAQIVLMRGQSCNLTHTHTLN